LLTDYVDSFVAPLSQSGRVLFINDGARVDGSLDIYWPNAGGSPPQNNLPANTTSQLPLPYRGNIFIPGHTIWATYTITLEAKEEGAGQISRGSVMDATPRMSLDDRVNSSSRVIRQFFDLTLRCLKVAYISSCEIASLL
jgi:hypothetical protein